MDINIMDMITDERHSSIIKVVGVGSFGVSALDYMYEQGIEGVDFFVCNTDKAELSQSKIPVKIPIGTKTAQGYGAGGNPDKGAQAVMEDADKFIEIFSGNAKLAFIAAGMGGGTGTGATPMIAKIAKANNLLTIVVLALPPLDEGVKRMQVAIEGVREVAKYADSVLIINNEKVYELYEGETDFLVAKQSVYKVLNTAVKGTSELITQNGYINLDFADVRTVTQNSGVAVMGAATASGANRANEVVKKAFNSPLLMSSDMRKAKKILFNISFNPDKEKAIKLSELTTIADYVNGAIGENSDIIMGVTFDKTLDESISVTIIATGFDLEGVLEKRYFVAPNLHTNTNFDPKNLQNKIPVFENEKVWATDSLSEDMINGLLQQPAYQRSGKSNLFGNQRTVGKKKRYELKI